MSGHLIVDLILICLLSGILCYAVILNRKLRDLYAHRKEITTFFRRFAESLKKAETSVSTLKDTTASMVMELNDKISQARALRDEVAFFLERGDKMSEMLDQQLRTHQGRLTAKSNLPETSEKVQAVAREAILSGAGEDKAPIPLRAAMKTYAPTLQNKSETSPLLKKLNQVR